MPTTETETIIDADYTEETADESEATAQTPTVSPERRPADYAESTNEQTGVSWRTIGVIVTVLILLIVAGLYIHGMQLAMS